MRKSVLAGAAIAAALGLALSGCSGGSASGSAKSGGVVHLTYWSGFTGGDSGTYKSLIKQFNKSHPDIQVTMDLEPWDTIAQKLPTALASGSGPDLATPDYNQATVLQYVSDRLALPLTSVVGNKSGEVPAKDLPSSVLQAATVKGKLYAVPASFTTLMLYYNVKLLDAAGISSPPKTMTQLQQDAVKLTSNGVYGIALPDNNSIANWPVLIWADGGDIVKNGCSALADTKTIDSVTSWADLIRTKGITQVGLAGQDADNLFSAGKAAFEINGPNAAGEYTPAGIDFKVAPVPVGSSGTPVTLASTVPTIVSAKTKHPAQAQAFLRWWLSESTQAKLAVGSGDGPARTDMSNNATVKSNALFASFAKQVPYARLFLPTEKQFDQINTNIFVPAIQSAERNGNVATTLKSASQQLNAMLGCK